MSPEARGASVLLVDGHAHLHDGVAPAPFLAAARARFRGATGRAVAPGGLRAALCLADFPGAEGFARLAAWADGGANGGWSVTGRGSGWLRLDAADGDRLWLVAGRQLTTGERLELLAVGAAAAPPGGAPLLGTIERIRDGGALPVLPWGAGKWTGRRGVLAGAASAALGRELPLGDSGGRPAGWPSRLLSRARAAGVPVIPGSDPLPIPADRLRNGSFGLALPGEPPEADVAAWLVGRLGAPGRGAAVFGLPLGPAAFLAHQVRLRLGRRPAGGGHAAG